MQLKVFPPALAYHPAELGHGPRGLLSSDSGLELGVGWGGAYFPLETCASPFTLLKIPCCPTGGVRS